MDIKEKLTPVAEKIVEIINSTYGMDIGTSLQLILEEKINKILPPEIGYKFQFNMSGNYKHIFFERDNADNFIIA